MREPDGRDTLCVSVIVGSVHVCAQGGRREEGGGGGRREEGGREGGGGRSEEGEGREEGGRREKGGGRIHCVSVIVGSVCAQHGKLRSSQLLAHNIVTPFFVHCAAKASQAHDIT